MTAVYVEEGLDKGAIWHFGEVAKEQRELNAGKAWADLSHRAVIAISGEDRLDRKSTRLNSSHVSEFRMPSSA